MCDVQYPLPSSFGHSQLRLSSPTQLPSQPLVFSNKNMEDNAFMSFWEFKAANKGQVNLKKGSRVQVIDKHSAGELSL